MKRHTYLTILAMGAMGLLISATTAQASGDNYEALIKRVVKTSKAKEQTTYSQQLRKSVNAASIQRLEQQCYSKNPGVRMQTFSLMGVMRLDGSLQTPVPLPDNGFTSCMASNMSSVTYPLPPGDQAGWPVAIQFNGTNGQVIYLAGDRQDALPLYSRINSASLPWAYTPVPFLTKNMHQHCLVSVWMSVGVDGRVKSVDVDDSTCSTGLRRAIVDAAGQWLYKSKPGAKRDDSMDVRVGFSIENSRVHLKL